MVGKLLKIVGGVVLGVNHQLKPYSWAWKGADFSL